MSEEKHPVTDDSEEISPFVFKKVSLSHLEMDHDIILQFRKATFVDNEYYREKDGQLLTEQFQNPINIAKMLFKFLTKKSKKELLKLKFTDIDETGEEVEKRYPLDKIFLMIFISSVDGQAALLKTCLQVFGYEKEQIAVILGEKEPVKRPQKKTPKVTQKKKR